MCCAFIFLLMCHEICVCGSVKSLYLPSFSLFKISYQSKFKIRTEVWSQKILFVTGHMHMCVCESPLCITNLHVYACEKVLF